MIHEAIEFAAIKHRNQTRKSTDIPYIVHPMEVMQILTANGCDEKTIVAGILHDTLEDTATTHEELSEHFGEDVADIVGGVTEDKSKNWKIRKLHTITTLPDESFESQLVCCADKVANLRSMLADYEKQGENLWGRFNAPKSEIAWYYRGVRDALCALEDYEMYRELEQLIRVIFD